MIPDRLNLTARSTYSGTRANTDYAVGSRSSCSSVDGWPVETVCPYDIQYPPPQSYMHTHESSKKIIGPWSSCVVQIDSESTLALASVWEARVQRLRRMRPLGSKEREVGDDLLTNYPLT